MPHGYAETTELVIRSQRGGKVKENVMILGCSENSVIF